MNMDTLNTALDANQASPLAGTAVERGNLYGFLAAVFRHEVTAEELRKIRNPSFLNALAKSGAAFGSEFHKAPEAELLEELAVEYCALFLGPGGHISPHESVFRKGGGGQLMGPEANAVRRYIEAAGFTYDEGYNGFADHISVELEFMAELIKQEARAWREGDFERAHDCLGYEKEFLSNHLECWAFTFCEQVEQFSSVSFYRQIARLTGDFLKDEKLEIVKRLAQTAAAAKGAAA